MPRCQPCARLTISHLVQLAKREFGGHFFPENAFYRHHGSFDALERSADDGCDFCQLIIDCFKGSPKPRNLTWPEVWEGPGCDIEESMYAAAKNLEVSDVKICINADHVFFQQPLESVEVFDLLLVQVGPREDAVRDEDASFDGFPVLKLAFSAPRENPVFIDRFRIGRFQVDPNLGSASNYEIAKEWLLDCRKNHKDCLVEDVPKLPKRVIDVGSESPSPECPRLLLAGSKRAEYVALSHCWGGRIATLLTTKTMEPFQRALPMKELPANFQDAITITRRLGIRYVWIDSLCIIQDSKEDWEEESKKMATIYRDATVTVSAMSSRGSSTGILHPIQDGTASAPMPRPVRLRIYAKNDDNNNNNDDTEVTVGMKETHEENLRGLDISSPLTSRGWTLQESILSPRHLFYGTRQIYWRCPHGFLSADGLPSGNVFPSESYYDISSVLYSEILRNPHDRKAADIEAVLLDYYELVQAYSHRTLTFDSDKLPAFSGLAQRLHPRLGGDYLAGIWTADFRRGLVWYSETKSCRHVKPYRAPSWSWAVTNQPTCFRKDVWPSNGLEMQLVEHAVTHRNRSNPYGEIEGAHIVVRARTRPLVRSEQVVYANTVTEASRIGFGYPDEPLIHDDKPELDIDSITSLFVVVAEDGTEFLLELRSTYVDEPDGGDSLHIDPGAWMEGEYAAVLVHTNAGNAEEGMNSFAEGLLVQRVSGQCVDSDDELYERVGYLVLHNPKLDWLRTWDSHLLKLI